MVVANEHPRTKEVVTSSSLLSTVDDFPHIRCLQIVGRRGTTTVSEDEEPGKFNADKFPTLRTVFKKDGTVTAGMCHGRAPI